ncbi:hypothetical protein BBO99_00005135 [Phytophthora kernoviae]|uniref:Metallo-beta-lactamase domain-containing protein n=1 Tax=Phytophthora kernoviae TaxID=325452 RepID=A0A3R7JXI4_9STRA|nr:hypothetical protein JM16_004955 [Phytophthora kernoviae]KAG2526235.1 hypothetical protein JM18_004377 [Phytophthora kernoviae]RLN31713.1 hypothetical protein BBI17_005284 [Phytophthora kernoviae]RLN79628.1 hypothetical protein BBO99_00005135 [Phytophthora kernoviae]
MEVVVLGCGPSSSVPSMKCVLSQNCDVCLEAHSNPDSKNRRLNPSLLVRNLRTDSNVLIDCGKTFRESALRIFPKIGVSAVHELVLTHDHADAILGMDDLREVQATVETVDPVTKEVYKIPPESLKVHCNEATGREVRTKFPYLIEKEEELQSSGASKKPFRWTAKVQIKPFESWKSFEACGIRFTPFPVIHGAGYTSFGFEFGHEFGARFVYISDVSELTEETKKYLNDASKSPIDVLVIDALYFEKYHSTHMNLQKVMEEIETIRPKRTLLTVLTHDHADATLGIDDLREVQQLVETVDPVTKEVYRIPRAPLPVHCCKDTGQEIYTKFPYLMEKEESQGSEAVEKPFRWTVKLRLEVFEAWKPFNACSIKFIPIPVTHGAGYTSFGFEFGHEFGARFVYISDVSKFPQETRAYLNDTKKPPIDILLIDALYLDKYNSAHMNLRQVVKEIETIRPKRTLLTGMSHELDYFTYSDVVAKIGEEKDLHIEMPYDGLRLAFP